MALDALAAKLQAEAAKGPVTLNASLISSAGVTPPPAFDDSLRRAFKLGASANGLVATFTPGDVGPVSGDTFSVTNAQISWLGAPLAQSSVTLVFTGESPVNVVVQTDLTGWALTDAFPYMTGWPFTLISLTGIGFVYSTVPLPMYSWHGTTIPVSPGQNIASQSTVPAAFQPIYALLGLSGTVAAPVLAGPIDVSAVDNNEIIYPTLDAAGPVVSPPIPPFALASLTVGNPQLGLEIDSSVQKTADGTAVFQTPVVYFGLTTTLQTQDGKNPQLAIRAGIDDMGNTISFSMQPQGDEYITPATVAGLVGGDSYFRYVPAELQAFLAFVGFEGLAVVAQLSPAPVITHLMIAIGSAPGKTWSIFTDANNQQIFEIKHFVLNWTLMMAPSTTNLVSFTATMKIFESIFPGDFTVSIDQDLRVEGAYDGTVSLDDVLRAITRGAIGLPSGVSIVFSDISVLIDKRARQYAFGFTTDVTVDFIRFGGKPLLQISNLHFALAASVPEGSAKTVYQAQMNGMIAVGPIGANVLVSYDSTKTPAIWRLKADLAQPLKLGDLLNQFFRSYDLPEFFPGSLDVLAFGIDATIPTKSNAPRGTRALALAQAGTAESSYNVSATVSWVYPIPNAFTIATEAQLALNYDGNLAAGKQFSGSAIGTISIPELGSAAELMVGYQFGPDPKDPTKDSKTLWVQWEGLRATYDFVAETVTFTLKGWSVGSLLQALVRMIGDPYFTLDSPWDVLNQISLDGLSVGIYLGNDPVKKKNRVTASYSLSSPIDLGFMRINGFSFKQVNGKVTIAIDGSTTVPDLKESPLFKPASDGQDVQNMPPVPGQGNQYFDLRLLALGQRVGIVGYQTFASTQAVIKALEGVPPTTGKANPVDPTSTAPGQPYYDQRYNWLVAADFGLLKAGKDWTVDVMVVFNDPDLYGLRLAFAGDKAKVLAGMSLDILYKKITDDIGLYQIDFTFPKVLRQLQFGAFAITLPSLGIQIYTNGDFLIDFGFPYNMDFSRSFTVQAQIGPVPVLGSAGFYFGKLSSATSTSVPKTTKGTFNPVVVFGFGAQLGVGKYIEAGILRAGFSITIFGIIEGVIAAWHPYQLGNSGDPAEVQGDYYFALTGQFGVIGKLFGTVDFVIIKADVSLTLTIYAKITYESYKAIPLSVSASVSVSVSISIDLGLFSISISFSFSTTISVNLTIGTDHLQDAPWYDGTRTFAAASFVALPPLQDQPLAFKPRDPNDVAPKQALNLYASPQFTVIGPPSGPLAAQTGAFAFMLSTDAPTTTGAPPKTPTSFDYLCAAMFPWLLDAKLNPTGTTYSPAAVNAQPVTRDQLEGLMSQLANTAMPPVPAKAILDFLASAMTVNVQLAAAGQAALQQGATIFPPFSGFSITVPDKSGSGTTTIAFDDYTTITDAYRANLAKTLDALAAQVHKEAAKPNLFAAMSFAEVPEQLQQFIFEDYFLLICKQLAQSGIDAMASYAYPLQQNDSLGDIRTWAVNRGNAATTLEDVVAPNLEHPLGTGIVLQLANIGGTVQRDDTLTTIAARYTDPATTKRWSVAPSDLIMTNHALRAWIAPGVPVTYTPPAAQALPQTYVTGAGDSFDSIAQAFGIGTLALSKDAALYTVPGLLVPAAAFLVGQLGTWPAQPDVPTIAYTTAGGDTTQSVMNAFGIALSALLAPNTSVPKYFDASAGAGIHVANLRALLVSDVWASIRSAQIVPNTAAMAARYQLHGMRLPLETGLQLPSNFAYAGPPPEDKAYGLYQLTGQQFPTPPLGAVTSYAITLSKNATLSWVQFGGSTATSSLVVDLTDAAQRLQAVLAYALLKGYDPQPAIAALPDVAIQPKRYPVRQYAPWSSSNVKGLLAVTGGTNDRTQPVLWLLPLDVVRLLEQRQAALGTRFGIDDALKYLPLFAPRVGVNDPATNLTGYTTLTEYTFGTRVDFQIKRLAQDEGKRPQRPDATDVVPPSQGNTGTTGPGLAPYNYELIGPSPADAMLLERLLTAMATLGEHVISGLFLLQPAGGSGSTGMVSRGDQEFLSFITQTNLSTETNPPPMTFFDAALAGDTQPRGIANTPADFVRLLWELSTVRSGGYYLYYQVPGNADPLPSNLFNTDGVATLTLVITYVRDPIGAGRLTNFVNALATTEAIDLDRSVLVLESQSAPKDSAALAAGATLNSIGALYGVSPGAIAALNSTLELTKGSPVGLTAMAAQMTQADLQSGDPFGAIAAYYATGTVVTATGKTLTGADLAAFNPGVQSGLSALARIPALTYSVSSANPAGNSFGSIAQYFRVGTDTVAAGARSVPDVFAVAKVHVDPQDFDVKPTLGIGNVGFSLTRANLGPPPVPTPPKPVKDWSQSEKDAYAKAYLFSLYTLITPSLMANPYFLPSQSGMPCGPITPTTPQQAAAFRNAATRRAFLAGAQSNPNLFYEQTIGIANFAQLNAAPMGGGNLPPASDNPYLGVGSFAQIAIAWADVFGNRTVALPPPSVVAAPVDYVDRPIGLSNWPNLVSSYTYTGTSSQPSLEIDFRLPPDAYQPPPLHPDPTDTRRLLAPSGLPQWRQNIKNDLATYTRIYFQLHQSYDALGVPGLSGNAIAISLTNTLLRTPQAPLPDTETQKVRDFVAACVDYLRQLDDGVTPIPVAPAAQLTVPVAQADVADDDIIRLQVALTLAQQAALTDPALAAQLDGLTATADIAAHTDTAGGVTLTKFAADFEALFTNPDWELRVGTGNGTPAQPRSQSSRTVWAVRLAKKDGAAGLYFELGADPSFYAAKPVAKTLRSGVVAIPDYTSGAPLPPTGTPTTFNGVDLNAWAQGALGAIDTFLTPAFAAPGFVIDAMRPNPDTDGIVAKILRHKETLAGAIASTTSPILVTSAKDAASRAAAGEKLRQELLRELSAAYTVSAIVLFDVTKATYKRPLPKGVKPPRFYGQPISVPKHPNDPPVDRNFAMSSTRIPLTTDASGATKLAFAFSSKNVADVGKQASVALPLTYVGSYVEYDITGVPEIVGYEQSSWISLVTGPVTRELAGGKIVEVPIPLRALPVPPTLGVQTAQPWETASDGTPLVAATAAPADLAKWTYGFTYTGSRYAQDSVRATIEFNLVPSMAFAITPDDMMFEALAKFTSIYPMIAIDFQAALRTVDGSTPPSDPKVITARAALEAFETLVDGFAQAYVAWAKPPLSAAVAAELPQTQLIVDLRLTSADLTPDGQALIEVSQVDLRPPGAKLPVPLVNLVIPGQTITPYVVPPTGSPQANVLVTYRYERESPASDKAVTVTYAEALDNPGRSVTMAPLELFGLQSAQSGVQIERNEFLVKDVATTDTFLFQTPVVTFTSPLVPLLPYVAYDLTNAGPGPLADALSAFYSQLLSGAGTQEVLVTMQAAFSYQLAPGVPRPAVPIALLPPSSATASSAAFVEPLVTVISAWRSAVGPEESADGFYDFEVSVFSTAAGFAAMPLLQIKDLYIAASSAFPPVTVTPS